jgi:hypothetical protein
MGVGSIVAGILIAFFIIVVIGVIAMYGLGKAVEFRTIYDRNDDGKLEGEEEERFKQDMKAGMIRDHVEVFETRLRLGEIE